MQFGDFCHEMAMQIRHSLVKKCPAHLSVLYRLLYTHPSQLIPFPDAYWRPEALQ
jgi:hypothetical protein